MQISWQGERRFDSFCPEWALRLVAAMLAIVRGFPFLEYFYSWFALYLDVALFWFITFFRSFIGQWASFIVGSLKIATRAFQMTTRGGVREMSLRTKTILPGVRKGNFVTWSAGCRSYFFSSRKLANVNVQKQNYLTKKLLMSEVLT